MRTPSQPRVLARRRAHGYRLERPDGTHLGRSERWSARCARRPRGLPSTMRAETCAVPPSRPMGSTWSPLPTIRARASGMRRRQTARDASTTAVRTAKFSPDGRRIVTASADQTARIWDADTAKPLRVLSGHDDFVWSAAFSPDGRRILTASFDRTVRVWDAERPNSSPSSPATATTYGGLHGRPMDSASSPLPLTAPLESGTRPGCNSPPLPAAKASSAFAWSPDGRRIVTAFGDPPRIWDVEVLADLDAQIAWSQAAKIEDLSDLERSRSGPAAGCADQDVVRRCLWMRYCGCGAS